MTVKLPTIKIEKPCVLIELSENLQGKIEIAARNPNDKGEQYDVVYY
jgi:hypothetical protein